LSCLIIHISLNFIFIRTAPETFRHFSDKYEAFAQTVSSETYGPGLREGSQAIIAMAMSRTIAVDAYVTEILMRDLVGHDHRPSAFLVYVFLLGAAPAGRTALSHAQIAEATGLSKRNVQDSLRHLERRGLIALRRAGRTEAAVIEPLSPWRKR
jgi:hypothetical protein